MARAQKTCTRISGQAEQEWLNFLRVIHQVTPADKELHLIADNYATLLAECPCHAAADFPLHLAPALSVTQKRRLSPDLLLMAHLEPEFCTQKLRRALNCTIRGPIVEVNRPKLALLIVVETALKLV